MGGCLAASFFLFLIIGGGVVGVWGILVFLRMVVAGLSRLRLLAYAL